MTSRDMEPNQPLEQQVNQPFVYRFGTAEFDSQRLTLKLDGGDAHLPDQAGRILAALLRKCPAVVTRDELRQAAWEPGEIVDDNAIGQAVSRLRSALGANRDFIRTRKRVGFFFAGVVERGLPRDRDDAASVEETDKPLLLPVTIVPAPLPQRQFRPPLVVTLLLTLMVAAMIGWWTQSERNAEPPTQAAGASSPITGRTLMVLMLEGERGAEVALALEQALAQRWKLLPGASQTRAHAIHIRQLLDSRKADVIVTGQTRRVGRYLSIRLDIHTAELTRHAWTEILPHVASAPYLEQRMKRAAAAMGLLEVKVEAHFPDNDAEQRFLSGHLYMDQAGTERSALHALTELESAVRSSPRYAATRAALCEALIRESMRTGNVNRLAEADESCRQALLLDPQSAESLRTQAYLDRKQGDLDAAIQHSTAALQLNATDVDALLVLAETHLLRHRNQSSPQDRQQALELLDRAYRIDSKHWKTPFTLARLYFNSGETAKAIAYQTQAAAIDANLQTLSNLGAFQFCTGDFAAARKSFVAAAALAPDDYVGVNQIATVDYQLHDFEQAAKGFARAIDLHKAAGDPDQYELSGNLADALAFAGHERRAADAYRNALVLVEKAVTKGDTNPSHRAHRVAFHTGLARLDPSYLNEQLRASLLRELDELEKSPDPTVTLLAAMSHARLGHRQQALRLRERATGSCPGYTTVPDFDGLTAASTVSP